MLVSLILAALCVVYALAFCSGTIYQMQDEYTLLTDTEYIDGARDLFNASQNVSNVLLILGIVGILVVVLNYITATHSRRNYYITNYVSIGIAIAYMIVLAVAVIVLVSNCGSIFYSIDMQAAQADFEDLKPGLWSYSDWMFPVGYVLAVLLIIDAVGFALNLLWKVKLMQGEKKLLESGAAKEAA